MKLLKNKTKLISWSSLLLMATGLIVLQAPFNVRGATYGASKAQQEESKDSATTDQNNSDGAKDSNDNSHDNQPDEQSNDNSNDDSNRNDAADQEEASDDSFHPVGDKNDNSHLDSMDATQKEAEVQKIHNDLQERIDQEDVKDVTINPDKDSDQDHLGDVEIKDHDGDVEVAEVPDSEDASIIEISTADGSEIKIRFNDQGQASIEQDDMVVETNLDITYDVDTGVITVTDPNGQISPQTINLFPAELLTQTSDRNKPSRISEIILEVTDNGQVAYVIEGTQDRNFLGLVPVSGKVTAVIDANTGKIIELTKPWYFNVFGWLFSMA